MDRPQTIPEMLGFASADKDRDPSATYSQLSYQARYLLYEDEAEALLRQYPGDYRHKDIERELNRRYMHDKEYRERINGGYEAMEAQMRADGRVSKEEADLIDSLNAQTEKDS
jgi:hypothetical protein